MPGDEQARAPGFDAARSLIRNALQSNSDFLKSNNGTIVTLCNSHGGANSAIIEERLRVLIQAIDDFIEVLPP